MASTIWIPWRRSSIFSCSLIIPDALTRGLRRKSDLARSMLERTRGDLTNAIEMAQVGDSLRKLEESLKNQVLKV